MKKGLLYLVLCAGIFVQSCVKTQPIPVYSLTYEVDVINNQPFDVTYYSDLFYASNELKTINVNDDTTGFWPYTLWWGTRTSATEDNDYYIKVEFPNYSNLSNVTHGVRVYANDTTLIEEFNITNYTDPIVLSGSIPEL